MLKKILLTLTLFTAFFTSSVFAEELGKKYEKKDVVRQEKIRAKMTPANYTQLVEALKNHTKNGKKITEQVARKMVNDGGLIGPITKCAESIANGGTTCDDGKGGTINVPPAVNPPIVPSGPAPITKKDDCRYDPDDEGADILDSLTKCVKDSTLVKSDTDNLNVDGGFKTVLNGWIQKIAGFLALGAIFAIVFGSLKLTLSMGEDENIKKAKDIIKWGVIGFIAVISAGFLIALVVNLIYSLAG